MLNWIALLGRQLPLRAGRAAAGRTNKPLAARSRRRSSPERAAAGLLGRPGLAGPPRRLLRRDRRARRLLADPQPDDARLRGARGRLQPRRGRVRRDQRPQQLHPRDGDLRRVRRARGRRSTCSATSYRLRHARRPGLVDRLPRDRGRAARPQHRASASASPRCSSARSCTGRRTACSPNVIDPQPGRQPDLIIQGLVVLFVGADVLILAVWNARRKLRRQRRRRRGGAGDDDVSTYAGAVDRPALAAAADARALGIDRDRARRRSPSGSRSRRSTARSIIVADRRSGCSRSLFGVAAASRGGGQARLGRGRRRRDRARPRRPRDALELGQPRPGLHCER